MNRIVFVTILSWVFLSTALLAQSSPQKPKTRPKPTATEPKPVAPSGASTTGPGGLPLRGYKFDVVTVNSSGTVTNRRKGQARPDLAQELTRVVEQRMDAYSHGNKQEYASFLADKYLSTDWTGGVLVLDKSQAIQRVPGPSAGGWFVYHIDEVQVCEYRGTAVMSFRVARDEVFNGHTFPIPPFHYRATNVFTRRGERWELIADHLTAIPVERTAVRVDPKTFDAYVGKYELGNGMFISVTTDGGKLYYQRTGRPGHELLPESAEVFFVASDPGSYIFRKDEQGRIAYWIYRTLGGQLAARRIR